MQTFIINTISDIQGTKQVFTCNGISKLWYGQWYDFTREIKQLDRVEVKEVQADGFNHALDLANWEIRQERYKRDYSSIYNRLKAIEERVLQKFRKKLKGKADRSKINSFLR